MASLKGPKWPKKLPPKKKFTSAAFFVKRKIFDPSLKFPLIYVDFFCEFLLLAVRKVFIRFCKKHSLLDLSFRQQNWEPELSSIFSRLSFLLLCFDSFCPLFQDLRFDSTSRCTLCFTVWVRDLDPCKLCKRATKLKNVF